MDRQFRSAQPDRRSSCYTFSPTYRQGYLTKGKKAERDNKTVQQLLPEDREAFTL